MARAGLARHHGRQSDDHRRRAGRPQALGLDEAEAKVAFLTTDPTVSRMDAVQPGRIAVISGAAMNPSVHTLYGAEQLAEQISAFDLP